MEAELAFADQRRRGRRHVAAGQVPADAELQILRDHIAELEGRGTSRGAVEEVALAVTGGTHVEIAVGQFNREVVADLVGDTGMHRPGEVGLGRAVSEVGTGAAIASREGRDIAEARGLDGGSTEAS